MINFLRQRKILNLLDGDNYQRSSLPPREMNHTNCSSRGPEHIKTSSDALQLKDKDLGRAGLTCNSDNTAREREKEKRSNSDILKICRILHGVRNRPK